MRRPYFVVGFLLVWMVTPSPPGTSSAWRTPGPGQVWAQQAPDPQAQLVQQQKSNQYLRIEYERCRQDVLDIWVKGDAAEQRAKDLEDAVRKLTEELTAVKGKLNEKPAN